jgi:hypothetical protein
MGLISWLMRRKDKVEIAAERIWLTKKAKLAGMKREIAEALGDPHGPDVIMVVAHFRNYLDELQAALSGLGVDRLLIADADALQGHVSPSQLFDESRTVAIVVGERHPLASHDEAIVEFARGLDCQCRLTHHVSLEDAIIKMFCSERIVATLRLLGMNEDEAIESRMVVRRVKKAANKIANSATGDLPADSAEQWLQRNCPEVWQKLQGAQ